MSCHLKGGVPQHFLKGKGVAAAIDKILAGEGVAEHMNRGFLCAPPPIEFSNGQAKGIL